MSVRFFKSAADFRAWLEKNHDKATELLVGFYKKGASKKGITYSEALDEALCFGWIDGIRRSVDASSYTNRFTPRKPKSIWSAVNVARAEALEAAGRMAEPGLRAFHGRDPARTNLYSFEQKTVVLEPALAKRFEANRKAWTFFEAQPPGYRRLMTWWVMSAKKDETRSRRLDRLIEGSEAGTRVGQIAPSSKSRKR